MSEQRKSGGGWMGWSALAPALMLSTCFGSEGSFETEKTICRELRDGLPSYSPLDTERTLTEGANYLLRFQAVCEGAL